MALRIAQSALEDFQAIQAYYAEQGVPHIGDAFVSDILAHAEMLIAHPDSGRVVPEFAAESVRELIHPPFRVVYLKQLNDIILIRVWRSERPLELPDNE